MDDRQIGGTPKPLPSKKRPRLRGRRVLLVGKDQQNNNALRAILEGSGCVVQTACDGAEALLLVRDMTRENAFDVLIAEFLLSDMSGYDFLMELKKVVNAEPVPLVLTSGFGFDPECTSVAKAFRAGLQAMLYFPCRIDQLLDTVEKIIDGNHPAGQT